MRPPAMILLLAVALAACRTSPAAPRFVVTATPIDVGVVSKALCIAVDPAEPRGVWWWEPGSSGCTSRSTGPDLFRAQRAVVSSRGGSDAVEVSFRMPLKAPPTSTLPRFADVQLIIENGEIRAESGARAAAARRADLELPLVPR